ncbi:ABC-type transport system ATP-binding protein (probable substrate branched-chain amino acids) (plasmid) [Natronomonas pharaonis DSM 2160]|uniref:ABC-type transport system ATP-binding protein (Probable substrate branched-chain amino acids) n=1 Tax=Natronomonas pharaonis (strain ATCC 35678 / DSM 2160 / CIP 103997 / JCM 8858 / NBRC 14720 / NCIMB 2260 / Gabara) TaxID=348780 RepID=Q3ILZ1_NATPD|nr:ABC transporter ATP-binding protein [Natronomonas pharaonis]CAI50878.1 ABC-type transport system ATP-binding protein (probable substrate branched-chain amino acids) [Natronomonas pharaonis DSM 2160]
MSEPIIETENLTKRFGALVANDSISISVDRGEIRGVIGPNGSGKTTFFNNLTGFYTPDEGAVRFNGVDITGWEPHRIAREGMARTFQIVSPFRNMTVTENLLAVDAPDSVDNKRERAQEILEFLEIDHIADNDAEGMSGGQQKLLELGRVLMLDPDCILLDEPSAGVNPALEKRILEHIQELNDQGTTFVMVEHDMDVMRTIADTVTVLDQGKIIAEGSFDDVTGNDRVREAYLGREVDLEEVLA